MKVFCTGATGRGPGFRSGEETFGDTIRWLVEAGHIPRKRAGHLVSLDAMSVVERHGAP
jgi:dihydroflavonol-4-reductase